MSTATKGATHGSDLRARLRAQRGANLLVTGPPLVGKGSFAVEVLEGVEDPLVLTATRHAARQLEDAPFDLGSVAVVDCTPTETTAPRVTNVSSPGDLTGISMPVSEFLDGAEQPGIAFDSLSSLLMYADEAPVFRFLSVLTGHVRQADGVALYTLDPESHEESTVATLAQLFDARVELREEERIEARVLGHPELPADWTPV